MASVQTSTVNSRVAVIDLTCFESADCEAKQQVARALHDSFSDTGFAIVTGTKAPSILTSALRKEALRFFDLSHENKNALNEGLTAGYGKSPYCRNKENVAQLLGDFSKANDSVETLIFQGYGPHCNGLVDPALEKAPADLVHAYLQFNQRLGLLRKTLERASELALKLEDGFFGQNCEGASESLRLAHYPDVMPEEGQMRYGAHVDSYGITLLNLDPLHPEGLQVQIDNEWVDVPFVEDSFVLNVGAMLSRWTNGVWKAAVHRVLFKPGRRLSIVTGALRPRDDVVINPITQDDDEPKFPPILAGDFCKQRVAMHVPGYMESQGTCPDDKVKGLTRTMKNHEPAQQYVTDDETSVGSLGDSSDLD